MQKKKHFFFLFAYFVLPSSSLKKKQPFEACFGFIKGITDFLEKLITWPRDVGSAIANGTTSFPAPF